MSPPGNGTPAWRTHPVDGGPAAASISVTSSAFAVGVPGPGRPRHDPPRLPAHLELDHARLERLVGVVTRALAVAARITHEAGAGGSHASSVGGEVGDDLVSLLALDAAGTGEVLVELAELAARIDAYQPRRSASRIASSSGVANPSASALTYRSNCQALTSVGAGGGLV